MWWDLVRAVWEWPEARVVVAFPAGVIAALLVVWAVDRGWDWVSGRRRRGA